MSLALLFSGQGSQHAGMLPWLAPSASPDDLLAGMAQQLAASDWRAAMADPDWATTNRRAQVLITGLAISAWQQLARLLPAPVGIAGYSVGELAAFAAAGVMDGKTALALAERRAVLMDEAAGGGSGAESGAEPGGLCGVTGLPRQLLQRLITEAAGTAVTIAISNGEDSAVIGGPVSALAAAEAAVMAHGGRATRLPIAVASHTAGMAPAAAAFERELASVTLNAPRHPLFSNAMDRVWTSAQARTALARQIANTVRWDEAMDQLAQRAPRCVLEVGGGQALARLWQQRHPQIPARSVDEFRSLSGIVQWVRAQSDEPFPSA